MSILDNLHFMGFFNKLIKIIFLVFIYVSYYNFNFLLFLFNKKNNNIKMFKICLCVIGKNENYYIKEFINYYEKIGYNHIFLYDNNDLNDERFEDVINNEIKKGFVSIINMRGYRGEGINPQLTAYKDCYDKNNKKFNWLSFFDIDEYLELNSSVYKIDKFFEQAKFINCQIIKLNWLFYTSNNSLYFENKPLQQRMTIPLYNLKINRHIKSTVRGNLPINYWSKAENPHTSINNFTTCSSSGKVINSSLPYNSPIEHEFAYLKHYQIKSFEEYCLKIKRGRPIPQYKIYRKQMIYNLFKNNLNNSKKLNIIKNIFNITSNYSFF